MTTYSLEEITAVAGRIRAHVIRMLAAAGSGHPGGSLSPVEIICALYFRILRHDPHNPLWPDRDRFILSKGHAAPLLYAVLAECGYLPVDELVTLRKLGSRLQGHTFAGSPPGVEMSSGSLGQGLSYSIGQCLAARLDGRDYYVYCLLGDGDCEEGQTWEAAMAAAHHELDHLVAIVDRNGLQNDGPVAEIMRQDPLDEKFRSFGWHVLEVDGHDLQQLIEALQGARSAQGRPTVIIAKTVKGKGVSFMENNNRFHGRAPTPEEAERALAELEEKEGVGRS
ncbi:MAG: transketolase [Dehalococcoidia bacterium]